MSTAIDSPVLFLLLCPQILLFISSFYVFSISSFSPIFTGKIVISLQKKKLCIINVYILKSLDRGIQLYYHYCNQSNKNSHPHQKFPLLFFLIVWVVCLFLVVRTFRMRSTLKKILNVQ